MIVEFLRWWTNELAALVPDFLREPPGPRFPVLEIGVSPTELVVHRVAKARREELGRLERGAPRSSPAGSRLLSRVEESLEPRKTGIAVRLPAEHALSRTVELPSAARENLREVMSFEIHRLTPFKLENVYLDGQVIEARRGSQTIRVGLIVVPRSPVDEALAMLPHWPAPSGAEVRITRDRDDVLLTFPPPDASVSFYVRLGPALLVTNVVLLAAAIALPLHAQHEELERLASEARAAQAAAEAAQTVEKRLEALRSELAFLVGAKTNRPALIEVFEDLSARIPDTTWLNRLEIQGDEARIAGFSESASALIGTLEESELFTDPRFISPVTRDAALGGGVERFFLSARIITERPADD